LLQNGLLSIVAENAGAEAADEAARNNTKVTSYR
jgi:hypothetical protein